MCAQRQRQVSFTGSIPRSDARCLYQLHVPAEDGDLDLEFRVEGGGFGVWGLVLGLGV